MLYEYFMNILTDVCVCEWTKKQENKKEIPQEAIQLIGEYPEKKLSKDLK